MQIRILSYPIDKRPDKEAEHPVAHNFLFMPDLVMVEVERVFEFLEGLFNTPAQAIDGSSFFMVKRKVIGDENMAGLVIFF